MLLIHLSVDCSVSHEFEMIIFPRENANELLTYRFQRLVTNDNKLCCIQGWLQRLGIQIEGGQGFLLDKLISISGSVGLSVCFNHHCGLKSINVILFHAAIDSSYYVSK